MLPGRAHGGRPGAACARYGVALRWHAGFSLPVTCVSGTFRGPAMPRLARRIAGDGVIDAAVIGRAAASVVREPGLWRDWGPPPETLQQLKLLWHVPVHHGAPAAPAAPAHGGGEVGGQADGATGVDGP